MSTWNPYITAWFLGAVVSLIIFNKMGEGGDEDSNLIREEAFLLSLFWPVIWTLVFLSLLKDLIKNYEKDN